MEGHKDFQGRNRRPRPEQAIIRLGFQESPAERQMEGPLDVEALTEAAALFNKIFDDFMLKHMQNALPDIQQKENQPPELAIIGQLEEEGQIYTLSVFERNLEEWQAHHSHVLFHESGNWSRKIQLLRNEDEYWREMWHYQLQEDGIVRRYDIISYDAVYEESSNIQTVSPKELRGLGDLLASADLELRTSRMLDWTELPWD